MAEDNYGNIKHDGIVPEQSVSGTPPALTATRDCMAWLFKNKFLRLIFSIVLAALICTAIYSVYIFTRHADPAEIFIFSAARYRPDKPFTVLVLARDAKAELPLQNQTIDLYMGLDGKELRKLPPVITGADGIAPVPVSPCPAGKYQLKAVLRDLSAVSNFELKSVYKSMLTSDKPMYQPGQTIHLRNLALNAIDLHPAPENDVNFKINDPNGNLVFDQTVKSSAYGIAAADFQLADQVNTGGYKITVSEGSQQTVKSVDVKNYHLPNYKITLNTDKKFYAPGDTVTGSVNTEYIWGDPLVNAKITLTASIKTTKTDTSPLPQPGGRRGRGWSIPRSYTTTYTTIDEQLILADVKGITDNAGRLNFKFQLPALDRVDFEKGTECKITVNALSPAEHKQELNKVLMITAKPLNISFVPEFGQLLPGVPGNIYLFVSDPYGDPVEAELKIGSQTMQTGKNGLALLSVPPAVKEMTVTAFDRLGHIAEQKIDLNCNTDQGAFILKTAKSVMNTGDQLQLEIIANNAGGQVYIDFVKDNTSLLLLPVKLNDKQTRLNFKIPADIFGTIQLHVYRILSEGKVVRDLRLIQVHPGNQLTIKSTFSKPEYRPGETANVNFQVKDQSGKPVQAALSFSAVDEMIFALQPDNIVAERAYFLLQEELLNPDYQKQASETLMSCNPSNVAPDAGFLLENKQNISNLQVACCSKYAERENPLVSKKIAFGNDLSLCLLVFVLILFLLFNIPFLMICLKGNSEPYWLVVEKRYWKDTQRTLIKLQLIFAAATLFSLFFIPCLLLSESTGMYATIIKHKINFVLLALLFAGFMFLLSKAFKARNHIFQYLSTDNVRISQKIILLIPWIYGFFIFIFFCFLLSAIYFPNTPGLSGLSAFFAIFTLFPTLYISGIRYVICSKEDFELRCQSRSNLGLGIGKYPGGYFSIWLMACFLYTGPIVLIYSFFVLMIIALFMPLTKTIDKLGGDGGGGYYHGSTSSREEYFKLAKDGQYFDLSGGQLCKADLPYIRRFFPETLYWQPQLITDEQGMAAVSFNVADSITNYRFLAGAVSCTGQLGSLQKELRVFQDFFIDFNPPENITSGDIISIPVVLYNYMKEPQQISVAVQADKAFSIIAPIAPVTLAPKSVTKSYLKVKFEHAGETRILLTAIGKNCKDAIERTINIVPNGKKETIIISDILQKSARYKFVIPSDALQEGHDFFMKIYPTPLPQITDTLKGMLAQPFGCFEQTSSITYPNILILRYLDSAGQLMPDIRQQALKYINQGYQRLLTFEVSGGGFSLYGYPPAQIRLSAYGLMLFADMAKVRAIDAKVIERTAEWLEKRQNGDGSWPSDYSQVSNLAVTAFVTMALTGSGCGREAVTKAAAYIIEQSGSCQDPYALALCANALLKINNERAVAILERLQVMRKENNEQCIWWESSGSGMFYSFRQDLDTETTALIANAMLSAGKYPETSRKAVIWLYRRGLNHYHSGNTFVQVMRTLISYGAVQPEFKAGTAFNLTIDLNGTTRSMVINDRNINLLQYLQFKDALLNGENFMTVNSEKSAMIGFQGIATYYLPYPAKTQKIKSPSTLELSVAYSKNSLLVGDTTTCKIYLKNKGSGSAPMGIIAMPVPPGFEVVSASLEEMVRKAVIDKFELRANRLILYFREFSAGTPLLLSIDLKAVYPVEITAPALTAYPYYEPSDMATSIPEKLTVIQANTGVE